MTIDNKKSSDGVPESMYGAWYKENKWMTSPYNYSEEVLAKHPAKPKKVTVRDVTLAEGQHQPGVHYTLDGMMRIAHALNDAGIRMMKQHIGDYKVFEFIKRLKTEIPDYFLHVTQPALEYHKYRNNIDTAKEDIKKLIDMGVNQFDFPGFNSWNMPEYVAAIPKQERLDRYAELTEFAVSNGALVEVGFVDVTRTPWEDLYEFWKNEVDAGASSIAVYDSYGMATPDGMKHLVERVKGHFDVEVLVHVHNDLGSAEATEIGGILGGATQFDCSINGLGDRAGNAATEKLIMSLEMNYGIDTGVNMECLLDLCRLVEKETGIEFPYIKPVSGQNVFVHESESHALMILSQGADIPYASKHEAYAPSVVGGEREVMFGRTSLTGSTIRMRLEQLNLNFTEENVTNISQLIEKGDEDVSLRAFDAIATKECG